MVMWVRYAGDAAFARLVGTPVGTSEIASRENRDVGRRPRVPAHALARAYDPGAGTLMMAF
jgi:hypothetical protein